MNLNVRGLQLAAALGFSSLATPALAQPERPDCAALLQELTRFQNFRQAGPALAERYAPGQSYAPPQSIFTDYSQHRGIAWSCLLQGNALDGGVSLNGGLRDSLSRLRSVGRYYRGYSLSSHLLDENSEDLYERFSIEDTSLLWREMAGLDRVLFSMQYSLTRPLVDGGVDAGQIHDAALADTPADTIDASPPPVPSIPGRHRTGGNRLTPPRKILLGGPLSPREIIWIGLVGLLGLTDFVLRRQRNQSRHDVNNQSQFLQDQLRPLLEIFQRHEHPSFRRIPDLAQKLHSVEEEIHAIGHAVSQRLQKLERLRKKGEDLLAACQRLRNSPANDPDVIAAHTELERHNGIVIELTTSNADDNLRRDHLETSAREILSSLADIISHEDFSHFIRAAVEQTPGLVSSWNTLAMQLKSQGLEVLPVPPRGPADRDSRHTPVPPEPILLKASPKTSPSPDQRSTERPVTIPTIPDDRDRTPVPAPIPAIDPGTYQTEDIERVLRARYKLLRQDASGNDIWKETSNCLAEVIPFVLDLFRRESANPGSKTADQILRECLETAHERVKAYIRQEVWDPEEQKTLLKTLDEDFARGSGLTC